MITPETVRHVAKLSRLALSPDEEARLTEQLGAILGYVDQLSQLDTKGIEPSTTPLPLTNVLRDDVERPSLTREQVLANAPKRDAGMFEVPQILG